MNRRLLTLFFATFFCRFATSQNLTDLQNYNGKRLSHIVLVETTVGTAALIGLHYLWYKKFPHSRFHLFNDNNEWLNMDKTGHAATAYNISAVQYITLCAGAV